MSCNCSNCGSSACDGDVLFMYRNKNGVSVFTGFVQNKNGDEIVWIGKDEKQNMPLDLNNQNHINFFMKQMQQYDK